MKVSFKKTDKNFTNRNFGCNFKLEAETEKEKRIIKKIKKAERCSSFGKALIQTYDPDPETLHIFY